MTVPSSDEQDAFEKLTSKLPRAAIDPSDPGSGGGDATTAALTGSVKLSSPNFLSKNARNDFYRGMAVLGALTIGLAGYVALQSHGDANNNWTGPTTMLLFVGLAAWAMAYFTVAGFGNVEVVVGSPQAPAKVDGDAADVVLTPKKDEKDVPLDTEVTAEFPKAIDKDSVVKDGSFTLKKKGETTPVAAAVSYDEATKKATLKPTNALAATTEYVAALTDSIIDENGDGITAVTWSFTTK